MRYRKVKLSCVMLGIFLLLFSVPASAEIDSPFEIDETASYDTGMAFYDLHLEYETEEYTGNGNISSFDVNQNGEIMINIDGTTGPDAFHINCYKNDGSFSHCIKVDPLSGGLIVALFDETDGQLLLYDVRPDKIYKIDKNGDCLEVKKVSKEFNSVPVIDSIRSKNEITINNISYTLSSKDALFETPTLTMTLPNGEVKTIFAYTDRGFINRFLPLLLPAFMAVVAVLTVYFKGGVHSSVKRRREAKKNLTPVSS